MYPIITISREFGSGGHSIGEKVAKALDLPFYDGEIVNRVASECGYAKEHIEQQGEYSNSPAIWMDMPYSAGAYYQSTQDEIFIAQKKVILECAAKGPCVIVGRCADYILTKAGIPCINIFIHSDMEHRAARVIERYGDKAEGISIEKRLMKKDKQRKTYYKYYTDRHWGDYRNYDLSIDSGKVGEDKSVELICNLAKSF